MGYSWDWVQWDLSQKSYVGMEVPKLKMAGGWVNTQHRTVLCTWISSYTFTSAFPFLLPSEPRHSIAQIICSSAPVGLFSHFSLAYILSTDIKCITAYFWRPTSSIYICSGSVRWKRSWVSCPPCTLHDQTKLQQNQNSAWMPMSSMGQCMCQMCHMSDTKEYLINPLFREHTVKQNVDSVNSNSFKLLTHTKMIS